jgi:hypothetical protein
MTKSRESKILSSVEIPKTAKEQTISNFKVLPVCYRCTQVPENGLYDGFRIKGMFFCSRCQEELFNAEQDSPEYQEFLFLTKGLLFKT